MIEHDEGCPCPCCCAKRVEARRVPKDTNPKTAFGAVKPQLQLIPPAVLVEEAAVMELGASKYGPYNWQQDAVSASTYVGAALRHLLAWWAGEDYDPESGQSHLMHVRSCMGIVRDAELTGMLVDDRPKTASAADRIRALTRG